MKKLVITFFILCISTGSLYSQNKTIRGRVIIEDLEAMPGTVIMINDTLEVGKTDLSGYFQIDIPVAVKKITFMTIGLEPATIVLEDACEKVELIMMGDCTYDFMTLRKVDKHRMKRFKKLPELHKEAFEKGIFKTPDACYTQEFLRYYEKKK